MNYLRASHATPVLAIVAAALTAACGGDPLVGSWSHIVSVADGTHTSIALMLAGDHTGQLHYVQQVASTASSLAGCTSTVDVVGFRWSTAGSTGATTLSFDTSAATETTGRTGCAMGSDDQPTTTGAATGNALALLTGPYTLSGDGHTLTITQSGTSQALVFETQ